ncbi:MAG: GNAT family N-acetyltransferase [Aureispira sp.]
MTFRKAQKSDAQDLTELTIRSKAYWGYTQEQMTQWKDDLTISPEYIEQQEVYTLTVEKVLIGYYSFSSLNDQKVKLDNIFIEPNYIRQGYGKILMNAFFDQVRGRGFKTIRLDSEPNAENFYKELGFKVVGRLESSLKDRFLPIMELQIEALIG